MASKSDQLKLRRALGADADFVRELRNEPGYLAMAVQSAAVSEDMHRSWYEGVLSDPWRQLWIVELADTPVGMVRLDACRTATELQRGRRMVEVSIALMPACRGQGWGKRALDEAMCQWARHHLPSAATAGDDAHRDPRDSRADDSDHTVFQAHVRPENLASLRLFESCRFVRVGQTQKQGVALIVLQRELNLKSCTGVDP